MFFLQGDFLQRDNLFLVTVFFSFPHIFLYKSGHRHALKEKFSFYFIFSLSMTMSHVQAHISEGNWLFLSSCYFFIQSHAPTHLSWGTREAREGRVRFLLTVYRFSMILSWTNTAVKKEKSRFVRLVFIRNEGESTTTRNPGGLFLILSLFPPSVNHLINKNTGSKHPLTHAMTQTTHTHTLYMIHAVKCAWAGFTGETSVFLAPLGPLLLLLTTANVRTNQANSQNALLWRPLLGSLSQNFHLVCMKLARCPQVVQKWVMDHSRLNFLYTKYGK